MKDMKRKAKELKARKKGVGGPLHVKASKEKNLEKRAKRIAT
jgi:hypothetical protein